MNRIGYAGYHDWRLPTLEEAMSLMESNKQNDKLYIDSIFDGKQDWIWTSDIDETKSTFWSISFSNGQVHYHHYQQGEPTKYLGYIRAVRFEHTTIDKNSILVKKNQKAGKNISQLFRSRFKNVPRHP